MPKYYKILLPGGYPANGGSGRYHRPKGNGRPGQWMPKIQNPKCCVRGYHVVTLENIPRWIKGTYECEIWECEVRGRRHERGTKSAWGQIRLLKKTPWSDKVARLFAADCAEHVLPIFEREFSVDKRPRRAIEAARKRALGNLNLRDLGRARMEASNAATSAKNAATRLRKNMPKREEVAHRRWLARRSACMARLAASHHTGVAVRRVMLNISQCFEYEAEERAAKDWARARLYYYLTGNVVNWPKFAEHRHLGLQSSP